MGCSHQSCYYLQMQFSCCEMSTFVMGKAKQAENSGLAQFSIQLKASEIFSISNVLSQYFKYRERHTHTTRRNILTTSTVHICSEPLASGCDIKEICGKELLQMSYRCDVAYPFPSLPPCYLELSLSSHLPLTGQDKCTHCI